MTQSELDNIKTRLQWALDYMNEYATTADLDPVRILTEPTRADNLSAICAVYLHKIDEATTEFLKARKICL